MSKHLEYLKETIQQTQQIENKISENLSIIKQQKEGFESAIGVIELSKLTDEYIERFQKELSTNIYTPTLIVRDGETLKLINMRKEILMELNENDIGDRVFFEWLEELFPLNKRLVNDEKAVIAVSLEKEKIYTEKIQRLSEILSQKNHEKQELTKEEKKEQEALIIENKIKELENKLKTATSAEKKQIKIEIKELQTTVQQWGRKINNLLNTLELSLVKAADKFL